MGLCECSCGMNKLGLTALTPWILQKTLVGYTRLPSGKDITMSHPFPCTAKNLATPSTTSTKQSFFFFLSVCPPSQQYCLLCHSAQPAPHHSPMLPSPAGWVISYLSSGFFFFFSHLCSLLLLNLIVSPTAKHLGYQGLSTKFNCFKSPENIEFTTFSESI